VSKVVFLVGEGEYESSTTMRPISDQISRWPDVTVDYRVPDVLEDWPNFPPSTFGGLQTLETADLLVLFTRFRVLPDEEMIAIAAFIERGGNIVALRTSTHAFHPVADSAWFGFASTFGDRVLGSGWTRHHGHSSSTTVKTVGQHEILQHIPARLSFDSWLYENTPADDSVTIAWGEPVNSEEPDAHGSPVAWIREVGQQRIFYTSLGSQTDLARQEMRTMLANAIRWGLRLPNPGSGT